MPAQTIPHAQPLRPPRAGARTAGFLTLCLTLCSALALGLIGSPAQARLRDIFTGNSTPSEAADSPQGSARGDAPGDQTFTLQHNGLARHYRVHVPPTEGEYVLQWCAAAVVRGYSGARLQW